MTFEDNDENTIRIYYPTAGNLDVNSVLMKLQKHEIFEIVPANTKSGEFKKLMSVLRAYFKLSSNKESPSPEVPPNLS